MIEQNVLTCAMIPKVIVIVIILEVVLSKFVDSPRKFNEIISEPINNIKCEEKEQWSLADSYNQNFNIENPVSFFLTAETLELYVHVNITRKAKFLIKFFSGNGESEVSYIYNGSQVEFLLDWCKFVFPIEYSELNNINLRGYKNDSGKVLIDSVLYKTKIYKIQKDNSNKAVIILIVYDDDEINETKDLKNKIIDTSLRNILKESNNDLENDIEEADNKLLSPWVIALIVLAAVTLISLVAVGAYHLGLSKGLTKNPVYIEDIEPARVVVIPRVRGVTDSPIGEIM